MAGIYVHIPFCKKKCIYCDFYSVKDVPSLVEEYVQALKKEYAMRKCELSGAAVRSVYFGGGTPSVLPVSMLRDVLSGMDDIADDAEMTVEVNPDDVDTFYAEALRAIGINRVSIGVQSFSDSELAFLNRRHDAKQAIQAVDVLRKAGFENISIDLIYGIPCQSLESWRRTLNVAVDIAPPHLSTYCLTYEEGTRLTRMRDRGEFAVCDDDLCVAQFELLAEVLSQNGYEQYEISNFAKRGRESVHNSAYWDFTPYLGLGASAHSFDGTVRRSNPANIRQYLHDISMGNISAIAERETLDQLYNEWIMTRLRTKRGMDLAELEGRFGGEKRKYAAAQIARHVDNGCVIAEGCTLRLTRKGIMVSDMIFRDLFVV